MKSFVACGCGIVALLLALPSFATVHSVGVGDFFFNPANLTVNQSDTVRWTCSAGFHNVRHTGTPSLFGNSPALAPWTYEFVFNLSAGDYPYICDVHPPQMIGTITVQVINSSPEPPSVPGELQLEQNYPNPFNSQTAIQFSLPTATTLRLTVLNELGQTVKVLFNGELRAGMHKLTFDAGSLATGFYYYRLETPSATLARKMYYLK